MKAEKPSKPPVVGKTTPVVKPVKTTQKNNVTPKQVPLAGLNNSVLNPNPQKVSIPKFATADFMAKHNPYLATLRDPLHCPGARIPDASSSQPSTTLQVVYHGSVSANANGVAGIIMGAVGQTLLNGPYMVPQLVPCTINAGSVAGAIALVTNSNSTTSTPFSDAGAAASTPIAISNLTTFLSSYGSYVRVVSCGLALRTTGNYTNNQGYFVSNSLPANYFGLPIGAVSAATMQNSPGAVTVPCIGALNGVECTYSPTDNRCFQYVAPNISGGTVGVNDPRFIPLNPGILFAFATGQTLGVTFLYDIVINYEVIVQSGQLAFGVRPSFQDPLAMSTASNEREEEEWVTSTPTMFTGQGGDVLHHMQKGLEQKKQVFQRVTGATPTNSDVSSLLHLCALPSRVKRSKRGEVNSVVSREEKPLFETVVDGLITVVKKVAPHLLSLL